MKMRCNDRKGFTLIELIFAMAGFSIMLIVAVSGFLNAVAIYNQANVSRDNQQQVRRAMEQLAGDIRVAKVATTSSAGSGTWLCLEGLPSGNTAYYRLNGSSELKQQDLAPGVDCVAFAEAPSAAAGDSPVLSNVNVFEPIKLQQSEADAGSVRVLIGVQRGSESSPRARQFSNAYELQSTYFLRGGL
jgi:prepilin-type N-terminal cleavage/methylation domain-containing protein